MKQTVTHIPGLTVHLGALWELPPDARVVLLLGDRGCDHLREIGRMAEFRGRMAFRIERAEDVQPHWLVHAEAVGIILGSTALQPLLEAVLDRLRQISLDQSQVVPG
jgi:4-hydroxy-3-methylbut-2-enyl diphosphate reductase